MKTMSALATAIISSLVVPGQAQVSMTSWTISELRASYLYEEDRTASVAFDLDPGLGQIPHYCSVSVHEIDVWVLPNVSEAYCEGDAGYLFDLTLHPPSPGTPGGAHIAVYTEYLHGSFFLGTADFQKIPRGDGRVDVKYTGARRFAVDIYQI